MTVLITQNFDSLNESQSITTAALGGVPWEVYSPDAAPVAQAAAAAHGARGAYIAPATGTARFNWYEAQTTATRVSSWYFRLLVDGAANTYLGALTDGSDSRASWRINADRTVTIRDGAVATGGASPQALAMNTWYRAEWRTSTTGQELRIFQGESTTPYITRLGALTNNQHTMISCGIVASPDGHSLQVDTIRIADDWTGPFATPPRQPTAYRYTGSNWQALDKPISIS